MKLKVVAHLLILFMATVSNGDVYNWTGSSDNDVFNESNWELDGSPGTNPPVGTIDPAVVVNHDLVISSGTAEISGANFGAPLDLGPGVGSLTITGGYLDALVAAGNNGVRASVDGTDWTNCAVMMSGTAQADLQFVLDLDITLTDSAVLTLGGGGNPVNRSTIDLASPDVSVHFLAETVAAFTSEHLSKFTVEGIAAVIGTNLTVVSDGGSGCIVTPIISTDKTAFNPTPSDTSSGIPLNQSLSWLVPAGITSCDVYFGTTSPPPFIQNQPGNSYDPPGDLSYNTPYYWRIDTHEPNLPYPDIIHTGTEWSFTTANVPGIVAHWDLEEGSGSTTTAAVGSPDADGTLVGATWVTSNLAPVPTGTAAAVDFDAINSDYISTNFAGVTGTNARTVATWIKADVTQNQNAVFISWGSTANGTRYSFRLNTGASDGTVGALRLEIAGAYAIAQTVLNDGLWHHVAITHETGDGVHDVLFYVDGNQEVGMSGQSASNLTIDTGTASPVMLGNSYHNTASYGLDGELDDVRVYDYALSAIEIEDLFIGTIPRAVNPSPQVGADHVDTVGTMSWDVVNTSSPTFDINIGTNQDCNDVLSGFSTGTTQSYTPTAGLLEYATEYNWRVDVTDGGQEYSSYVWSFTTGGKATDPVPADGGTGDWAVGTLSWTGDALIASYDVYFGPVGNMVFVDNYTNTSVGFGDLAQALSEVVLSSGDYQWQVNTRDGGGVLMVTGDVWSVTIPMLTPIAIDDFISYADTPELLAKWDDGTTNGTGSTLTLDALINVMEFDYDNTGLPWKSEAELAFSPPANWIVNGMKTMSISFRGLETNGAESMYLALSDGIDTVTFTYSSADATTDYWWRTWYISLSDFIDGGLDLANITSLVIGFGDGTSPGGAGLMYISEIMLYAEECFVELQPVGDRTGDCQVNLADLLLFIGDWLMEDYVVSAVAPQSSNLRAQYNFEETTGTTANDSSGLNHHATVDPNDLTDYWDINGYQGRCLKISRDLTLSLPAGVFGTVSDAVTVSVWINGEPGDYPLYVDNVEFSAGAVPIENNTWDRVLWDIDQAGSYGGSWNHYAVVKQAGSGLMRIYHNGVLVEQSIDASNQMNGAQAGESVMSLIPWEGSPVKVDEMCLYDYALTAAEIAYLAAGSGGEVLQPIYPVFTQMDFNTDGIINLSDYNLMAGDWLIQP